MNVSAFDALCRIVWEISRVEFQLDNLPGRIERESQKHWFEVYNGDRLPRNSTRRRLTPRQHFLLKLMNSVVEIDRTFRLMCHLEIYASKSPRLKGEVTTLDFLTYLIESHLHETYILRERIQAFSKFLERAYRKGPNVRRVTAQAKRIHRGAERALRHVVALRGKHVHVRRHRVPDIERVEFMREFGKHAPPELKLKFDRAYASAFREVRKQRLEHISELNESCQQLLAFVGANALHIILRKNLTEVVFPMGLTVVGSSLKRDAVEPRTFG